jgi:enamine deaminase RidA (YjgF/YER057c/UK114 family)
VSVKQKMRELGLSFLPETPNTYLAGAMSVGRLVYTSGRTSPQKGKVGDAVLIETGAEAARDATLRALFAVQTEIGNLDRIVRVIRLAGFVNCAEGFSQTSQVMNGGSDLLYALFGPERGRHLRTALGVYQLPGDAAVEVELVVEVEDDRE